MCHRLRHAMLHAACILSFCVVGIIPSTDVQRLLCRFRSEFCYPALPHSLCTACLAGTKITRSDVLRGQSWRMTQADGSRSTRGGCVNQTFQEKQLDPQTRRCAAAVHATPQQRQQQQQPGEPQTHSRNRRASLAGSSVYCCQPQHSYSELQAYTVPSCARPS